MENIHFTLIKTSVIYSAPSKVPLQLFPLLMNLLCFRVRVGRQPVRTLVGSGQKCRGVVLLPFFRGDQKAVHMA